MSWALSSVSAALMQSIVLYINDSIIAGLLFQHSGIHGPLFTMTHGATGSQFRGGGGRALPPAWRPSRMAGRWCRFWAILAVPHGRSPCGLSCWSSDVELSVCAWVPALPSAQNCPGLAPHLPSTHMHGSYIPNTCSVKYGGAASEISLLVPHCCWVSGASP